MVRPNLMSSILSLVLACASVGEARGSGSPFAVETLLERKDVLWGFDFLPGGDILLTEREGTLLRFDPRSRKATAVEGVPKVVAKGQGGLLDVRVHPDFANNSLVYFTYSQPVRGQYTTALARAALKENKLTDLIVLLAAEPANANTIHFGSRIEFDGKGHVFFTVGDRNERHDAQSLSSHRGKVLRLREDGKVPADNPFANAKDARPEIWSFGHRNPQGLVRRPDTDELWLSEFGPRGGDEINLVKPGKNFGWPVVTYGREYWGPSIGEGKEKAGMEKPVIQYVPSISPSAIAFYGANLFPAWKGNLFVANLSGTHLRRLVLDGQKVVQEESLLAEKSWRFRNVRTGPDGALYFSTDEGLLGRLVPAQKR